MSKFSVTISITAQDANEAKRAGQLLQNITDKIDNVTKDYLYEQVRKNPDYFKIVAVKLTNPLIQKMFG